MKRLLTIFLFESFLIIALLESCNYQRDNVSKMPFKEEKTKINNRQYGVNPILKDQTTRICSERTLGNVLVYDTIDGYKLFSLEDNISIKTEVFNDTWYIISLMIKPDSMEASTLLLMPGVKYIPGSAYKTVELFKETKTCYISQDGLASISGFLPVESVNPETIIEEVLMTHLNSGAGLGKPGFQSILQSFDFHYDNQFEGFEVYFMYSFSIEPPTGWRVGLVFKDDNLAAILHSRELKVDFSKMVHNNTNCTITIFADSVVRNSIFDTFVPVLDYLFDLEWIHFVPVGQCATSELCCEFLKFTRANNNSRQHHKVLL